MLGADLVYIYIYVYIYICMYIYMSMNGAFFGCKVHVWQICQSYRSYMVVGTNYKHSETTRFSGALCLAKFRQARNS